MGADVGLPRASRGEEVEEVSEVERQNLDGEVHREQCRTGRLDRLSGAYEMRDLVTDMLPGVLA